MLAAGLIVCLMLVFVLSAEQTKRPEPTSEDIIARIEAALGDEYRKQSMTELVQTFTYKDMTNHNNQFYQHVLKTTFYEGNPAEVTGLYTAAFRVLFDIESMECCKEMKIHEWDAAIYRNDQVAYLCWTFSPEVSCALEYNPDLLADADMIRIVESIEKAD